MGQQKLRREIKKASPSRYWARQVNRMSDEKVIEMATKIRGRKHGKG